MMYSKFHGLHAGVSDSRWAGVALAIAIIGVPIGCSLATQGNDYNPATSGGAAAGSPTGSSTTGSESGGVGGAGAGSGGASAGNGGQGGSASSDSAGAGGSASGSGGSGSGGGDPCPTGMGPSMVVVSPGAGSKSFCIDSTEVTVGQYAAWLGTDPLLAGEPDYCTSWNQDHGPKLTNECQFYDLQAVGAPNHPIACVNWCDAYAFCKAAGKRLCGAVGGGPLTFVNSMKSVAGQWWVACSAAGSKMFPYGGGYDGKNCNDLEWDKNGADVTDVGSIDTCEGGYPGIFDMSGNVSEWVDSCAAQSGANDQCFDRNGSYIYGEAQQKCEYTWIDSRSAVYPDLGFRCCADIP